MSQSAESWLRLHLGALDAEIAGIDNESRRLAAQRERLLAEVVRTRAALDAVTEAGAE